MVAFKSYIVIQYRRHKIKRIAEKKYLLILWSNKWDQYIVRTGIYLKPLLRRFYKVVAREKQFNLFETIKKDNLNLSGLSLYENLK